MRKGNMLLEERPTPSLPKCLRAQLDCQRNLPLSVLAAQRCQVAFGEGAAQRRVGLVQENTKESTACFAVLHIRHHEDSCTDRLVQRREHRQHELVWNIARQ